MLDHVSPIKFFFNEKKNLKKVSLLSTGPTQSSFKGACHHFLVSATEEILKLEFNLGLLAIFSMSVRVVPIRSGNPVNYVAHSILGILA